MSSPAWKRRRINNRRNARLRKWRRNGSYYETTLLRITFKLVPE